MSPQAVRRLIVTVLAFIFVTSGLGGFFQANVQEWAKANNQDQYLVKYLGPAMNELVAITQSPWFIFITGALVGAMVYAWVDYCLRKRVVVQTLPASPSAPAPVDWSPIDIFERFTCLEAACYLHGKYPALASAKELNNEPEIYQYIREFDAAKTELNFYLSDGQIDPGRAIVSYLMRKELDAYFEKKGMNPEFMDRKSRARPR